MGNICRSPTAEGMFRQLVREHGLEHRIDTDSAGTHGYHVGRPADARAQAAAKARGLDISDLRARQVTRADFEVFHWIVAMDNDNLINLRAECPADLHDRIHRLLDFAPDRAESEVPDPYFGGDAGFRHVLDLVESGSRGLLKAIRDRHGF
ncbi:MAG: low molecular weight phosphotyrosine protein phosphatase [Ectothiorhodospiraceae bacterium]|nr:low molecular weight phosphotyrosine protein phosphatase [Ectothiorhodospiraceae bacterium]